MKLDGLTEEEARCCFYVVDINGLLHTKLAKLEGAQRDFAQEAQAISSWRVKNFDHISLIEVMRMPIPTFLCGYSTPKRSIYRRGL